jgi:hypothetical protein
VQFKTQRIQNGGVLYRIFSEPLKFATELDGRWDGKQGGEMNVMILQQQCLHNINSLIQGRCSLTHFWITISGGPWKGPYKAADPDFGRYRLILLDDTSDTLQVKNRQNVII